MRTDQGHRAWFAATKREVEIAGRIALDLQPEGLGFPPHDLERGAGDRLRVAQVAVCRDPTPPLRVTASLHAGACARARDDDGDGATSDDARGDDASASGGANDGGGNAGGGNDDGDASIRPSGRYPHPIGRPALPEPLEVVRLEQ